MQKVQVITGPYVFAVRAFSVLKQVFMVILRKILAIFYIIKYTNWVCLLYAGNFLLNERTEHK